MQRFVAQHLVFFVILSCPMFSDHEIHSFDGIHFFTFLFSNFLPNSIGKQAIQHTVDRITNHLRLCNVMALNSLVLLEYTFRVVLAQDPFKQLLVFMQTLLSVSHSKQVSIAAPKDTCRTISKPQILFLRCKTLGLSIH